jgi:hypothetical protein
MKPELAELQDAIRRLHNCESIHVRSDRVTERFQGQTVWDGSVETFDLTGHPQATRCYAWKHLNDDGSYRFVAVLKLSPVDSPIAAVRAAIVAESKNRQS